MGGGGGQTGGSVIQYTDKPAALEAGQIGARAAEEAGRLGAQAIDDAILNINRSYAQARYDVQPYRTAGIQALDQLNQYLGLDPYNPGKSPEPAKAPVMEDIMKQFTPDEVKSYIRNNSITNGSAPGPGQSQSYIYQGAGSKPSYAKENPANPGGTKGTLYQGMNEIMGSGDVPGTMEYEIRKGMAQQPYNQALKEFEAMLPSYERDKAEYEQNKDWYDKYSAEGPLSADQIAQRITNLPGYQAELGQGIEAINKNSAARGSLGGGGVLRELMSYGQNTLSKFYGNELSRLASIAGMGQQAASETAGISQNQGNSLAMLNQAKGDIQANAALAKGNSLAQALIAANQKFDVIGQSDTGGGGLGGIGQLAGGIGSLVSAFSDEKLKDYISTPSTKEILFNIREMSLDKWKYKGIDEEHIGPYAQQFKEMFKVGDGQSINMVDCIGVLFAAVKELDKKLAEVSKCQ